jgi:hypothetical protein
MEERRRGEANRSGWRPVRRDQARSESSRATSAGSSSTGGDATSSTPAGGGPSTPTGPARRRQSQPLAAPHPPQRPGAVVVHRGSTARPRRPPSRPSRCPDRAPAAGRRPPRRTPGQRRRTPCGRGASSAVVEVETFMAGAPVAVAANRRVGSDDAGENSVGECQDGTHLVYSSWLHPSEGLGTRRRSARSPTPPGSRSGARTRGCLGWAASSGSA